MSNNLLKINLFPINISILPDELVPLHIFEDRYKKMVSNCLENNQEFGIIWILGIQAHMIMIILMAILKS